MMSSPDGGGGDNISRSGRVRKKSSKLADFQSPEEVAEAARQRRASKKDDQLSGSLFEADDDNSDSDLDMDIDQFDTKPEDLEDIPDLEEDDLSSDNSQNRTEIVKKPLNLPVVEGKKFSPFILWAKYTKPDIIRQNPDVGPSHLRVKMAELWNSIPKMEKLNWARKAKKLNNKSGSPQKMHSSPMKSPIMTNSPSLETRMLTGAILDTESINIASHLKLLGESLSIIGERLTEHEGQIAVSGSLSVLLDSLLCALGPLMCLTQRVPELNGTDADTLSQTLDNVAYIMPGL